MIILLGLFSNSSFGLLDGTHYHVRILFRSDKIRPSSVVAMAGGGGTVEVK